MGIGGRHSPTARAARNSDNLSRRFRAVQRNLPSRVRAGLIQRIRFRFWSWFGYASARIFSRSGLVRWNEERTGPLWVSRLSSEGGERATSDHAGKANEPSLIRERRARLAPWKCTRSDTSWQSARR